MKNPSLFFFLIFLLSSCQKDPDLIELNDPSDELHIRSKSMVAVCHNGMILQVNVNSVSAHQAHGDAVDMDGDGFFDIASDCSAADCNDDDPFVNPDAEEICDGVDNNCDGTIDEDVKNTYYADADGDGFGDPESPLEACDPPSGYISDNTDCDDTDPNIYPGAPNNNGDTYFDDFNDCNLIEYTYSGGSISITGSGKEGCGVYMTHFAGQQSNNFYATGKEF